MSEDRSDKILIVGQEPSRSVQRICKRCSEQGLGNRVVSNLAQVELGLEISANDGKEIVPSLKVKGESDNYLAIWCESMPSRPTFRNQRDRSYAFSETAALLVALISELSVPIINPPKDLLLSMLEQDPSFFRGIQLSPVNGEITEGGEIGGPRYLVVKIGEQLFVFSFAERRINAELVGQDIAPNFNEMVLKALAKHRLNYWYVVFIVEATKDGFQIRSFSTKISRAIFGPYIDCIIERILRQIKTTCLLDQSPDHPSQHVTKTRSPDELSNSNWV